MDGVHDLKRTVRILVLETFKDEVHKGCDRFSDGRSEGRGANRNTIGLVGITQADESVKGE